MKKIALIALALVLTGCGPTLFMKTGDYSFEPLNSGCDFNIYTTNPNKAFKEVGLVEFGNDWMNGYPTSLAQVKQQAAPFVCQSGGNGLLVWEVNGFGRYLKATIIRFEEVN